MTEEDDKSLRDEIHKGELLNVDVSARQLDSLVRLLDSLK